MGSGRWFAEALQQGQWGRLSHATIEETEVIPPVKTIEQKLESKSRPFPLYPSPVNRLPVPTLLFICFALLCVLALAARNPGFTKEKYGRVGYPGFKTEHDIVTLLGPGQEVKDAYTESVISAHSLPLSARFLRYSESSQPGIFYHVVLVDGRLSEVNTWDARKKP